jgi:MauM/NapG family ferredoxin protein
MIKNSIIRWLSNFFNPKEGPGLDLGRRQLLAAGIVGLGGGLLFNAQPLAGGRSYNPGLVRPPGAVSEDEFLGMCVRCGECMKVCPTNVIQPTMFEAGLEGLWSPMLKTRMSYCEYKCKMCMEVCPTEAIVNMTLEDKQEVKVGLAHIDRNRCLPWSYARPCEVCGEHCPLPEKAIWLEEVTVINAKGKKLTLHQPHINAELCIGCGICEYKCPVSDEAAIKVTSVGETRHFNNQFLSADRYSG